MAMNTQTDRLAILDTIPLLSGAHPAPNGEFAACAMELVSYIAGESWSDHPTCVCSVLGAFVRAWNDGLPDDERDALLKPLLPRLIGTAGSQALADRRSLMAADWLIRVHTPAWLRLAKLDAHANALAALPEITAFAQVPSIRGPIEAARRDAAAALDAARDAAWDAARAARAAARAAAWATAATATATAATAATATRAAAWDAAWDALNPTRLALVNSARELVERMIEARD